MLQKQYPENLETSILGLGELEHMNKLYVSGMLQHIMNYIVFCILGTPITSKSMKHIRSYNVF